MTGSAGAGREPVLPLRAGDDAVVPFRPILRQAGAAFPQAVPTAALPKLNPGNDLRRHQEAGRRVLCGPAGPHSTLCGPFVHRCTQQEGVPHGRAGELCGQKWPPLPGKSGRYTGANLSSCKDLERGGCPRDGALCGRTRPHSASDRHREGRLRMLCGRTRPHSIDEIQRCHSANFRRQKGLAGKSAGVLCGRTRPHSTPAPRRGTPSACYAARRGRIATERPEEIGVLTRSPSAISRLFAAPEVSYYAARSRRIISTANDCLTADPTC